VDAGIDRLVSEAAVDVDRAEGLAQRLAQLPAEVDQGGELQLVGGVVYAVGLCPGGTGHLFVAEVRTQHEILSLCHNFFNFLFVHSSSNRDGECKVKAKKAPAEGKICRRSVSGSLT
jgi:hypothetical protein